MRIKPALFLLLNVPLIFSCSHLREGDVLDPNIRGVRTGEGRFLDRDLNEEYGRFPIAIEIHADDSVTGTVGAAALFEGVIKSRPEDFLVSASLEGPVHEEGSLPEEKKDCVILIMQPLDATTLEGNVHLKTNFTFDFSMRVCGLELSRSP